jgi:hypothetical protein
MAVIPNPDVLGKQVFWLYVLYAAAFLAACFGVYLLIPE